MHLLLDLVNG